MYCPKCGTELPDDSQFCRKCGHSLSLAPAGGAATAPTPKPRRRIAIWFLVPLLLFFIVLLILNQSTPIGSYGARAISQIAPPLPHAVKIGSGVIWVNAAGYAYFTLIVPAGAKNVRVQGRFSATGGTGNDIEVSLFSQDDYTNWQNGHPARTIYNSGKVTVSNVNAVLPNDAGTYYLIFNNKFSLLTPKAVQESLTLTYYQ